MKFLVSSLFLIFLSGTYGAAIEQQDVKPSEPQRPDVQESMKSLLYHSIAYGADVVANWESSEEDREAALSKREKLILASYSSIGVGITEYVADIYKEVNKELEETYPVYYNNVVPLFASFFVKAFQHLSSAVEEIQPHVEKYQERLRPLQDELWEDIRPIIQNRTRSTIETLNANLKPFIDGVRKEVAAASIKEDKLSPEEEATVALMEEQFKNARKLQKFMFDDDQIKKIVSDLKILKMNA